MTVAQGAVLRRKRDGALGIVIAASEASDAYGWASVHLYGGRFIRVSRSGLAQKYDEVTGRERDVVIAVSKVVPLPMVRTFADAVLSLDTVTDESLAQALDAHPGLGVITEVVKVVQAVTR